MKQFKVGRLNILAPKVVGGFAVVVLVMAALAIYSFRGSATPHANMGMADMEVQSTPAMKLTFAKLSNAHTDVCRDIGDKAAIERYINSLPSGSRLQGSCCSPMDMNRYVSQVTTLKKYASISQIPPDPYDVSAYSAKQMLGYYDNIQLTSAQQSVHDNAKSMTTDKGWCCCQCWAWYTHAGLAKYLITQQNYTAQQVATLTNLEDCCGGK